MDLEQLNVLYLGDESDHVAYVRVAIRAKSTVNLTNPIINDETFIEREIRKFVKELPDPAP